MYAYMGVGASHQCPLELTESTPLLEYEPGRVTDVRVVCPNHYLGTFQVLFDPHQRGDHVLVPCVPRCLAARRFRVLAAVVFVGRQNHLQVLLHGKLFDCRALILFVPLQLGLDRLQNGLNVPNNPTERPVDHCIAVFRPAFKLVNIPEKSCNWCVNI